VVYAAAGAGFIPSEAEGNPAVPAAEVVRAQRFELVDSQGKVRVRLDVAADGSPGLTLHDREQKVIWEAP